MATVTVELECIICRNGFSIPKLLRCGHHLCRHCLVAWMESSETEATCPICRHSIFHPQELENKSYEDIADELPTDLTVESFVEAERVLYKQHVCCVCVDAQAVSLCLNCRDMFCQACSALHRKQPKSKHHCTEDLASLTMQQLASKRAATCVAHEDQMSSLYCNTHAVHICSTCAITDHQQCLRVTKLESMREACAELSEVEVMLSEGERQMDEAISNLDIDVHIIDQCEQQTLADIDALGQRLKLAVSQLTRRLENRAVSMYSALRTKKEKGKSILVRRRVILTSHKQLAQRVTGFLSHSSFNTMTTTLKTRSRDLECSTTLPPDVEDASPMTLVIDPAAVSSIEQQLSRPLDLNSQAFSLGFHENYGKLVMVSSCHRTAHRTARSWGYGLVLSQTDMKKNFIYEVQIEEVNNRYSATFLGVVTANPATFDLPHNLGICHPAVLCVGPYHVRTFGKQRENGRPILRGLPVGSRVGLLLDNTRRLHLYVNDQHHGVIAPDIPQPCYFAFDLYGYCTKVTGLTLRRISPGDQATTDAETTDAETTDAETTDS